jgi:transposase
MASERFTHEFEVMLEGSAEKELAAAFEVGRHAYNALLGEGLRRVLLMRESRAFLEASRMPRGRERTAAFRRLRAHFGLRRYDLYYWASRKLTRQWLGRRLDAHVIQTLAARAHTAAIKFCVGVAGRPRFKGRNQFDSLEGESNRQGIRYMRGLLVWRDRRYRLRVDQSDVRAQHALSSPIQRVRLVRRRIRGRTRYFAQLVCRGQPLGRSDGPLPRAVVGIDPGPRIFAIHAPHTSALVDLSQPRDATQSAVRRLERALDRRRRAANPTNYDARGRGIKGHTRWHVSRGLERARTKLADLLRVRAAARRNAHGRLANAILLLGNDVRIERNTYRSFQRNFGRSVGRAAPGMFVRLLVRKAANAGAQVHLVPTTTRLSQTCHGCGKSAFKPRGQRVHICVCGVGPVQRDLYSAFLLTMTTYDRSRSCWVLDADQARSAWSGARLRLPVASRSITVAAFCAEAVVQAASGALLGAGPQGTERLAGEAHAMQGDARNVVAEEARVRESFAGRGRAEFEHPNALGLSSSADHHVEDPAQEATASSD